MSYKEWASAQADQNKANSDGKSKAEPTVARPIDAAGNPDKAPIKVTPVPKS